MAIEKYAYIFFVIRMIFMPNFRIFAKYLGFIIYSLDNAFGC